MTGRRNMIDLVGRAAERLDLNAPGQGYEAEKIEPWLATPEAQPEPVPEPNNGLEPTILASLAGDAPAPAPPSDLPTRIASASFPLEMADPAPSIVASAAAAEAMQSAEAPPTKIVAKNHVTLDWAALEENGYLTPESQKSLKAEEYRIIKRPLLRAAFNPEGRHKSIAHVAMVTSPCPGDGKTFTAINLALSIASERDLHVLLIDADIRNQGMSRSLGLEARPGLMELLTQTNVSMPEVLLHTDVANLSIIPAGLPTLGSTEIFASQAMVKLVRDITTRYMDRFIIFDAPPALASSEPGVLSSHVGQVIMVVRAGETGKRAIAEALAQVDTCRTVNFVLNQMPLFAGQDRFGYYGKSAADGSL